ncbi:polysaccharide deacetylase family protein [Lacticaseibacillus jixianensis]|uniref:Polysaccharide deacetylase family protein n=2 Tax=Lacticaseibacillus jixianensis TaxID=2486012 RepID=A0ABW4B8F6_9LACO|nr:polysaccharide deacetylase family protein [Lacticaseibacillus jixianensis]
MRKQNKRLGWRLVALAVVLVALGLGVAFVLNRPTAQKNALKAQEAALLKKQYPGTKVQVALKRGQGVFFMAGEKTVPAALKEAAEAALAGLPATAAGKAVVVVASRRKAPLALTSVQAKLQTLYRQHDKLHRRRTSQQLMVTAAGKRATVADLVSDDFGRRALDYAAQTAKAEAADLDQAQLAALMKTPMLAAMTATNFRLDDQALTILTKGGHVAATVPRRKIAPYLLGASAAAPSGKLVALTFDDGPNAQTTPGILKALADHHVKATFFELGTGIVENPALAKSVKAAGHEVGTHTYDHLYLPGLKPAAALDQMYGKNLWTYYHVFKTLPPFIRPPYGAISKANADLVGMPAIQWSVDSQDWKSKNRDAIIARIKATTRPGGIVLMHDIQPAEVAALPAVIAYLKSQGYQFVTVSQLLGQKLLPGHQYFGQGDERVI